MRSQKCTTLPAVLLSLKAYKTKADGDLVDAISCFFKGSIMSQPWTESFVQRALCRRPPCPFTPIQDFGLTAFDNLQIRIGYKAAILLDRLMDGDPPPNEPILVPPIGIVQRQSSDTMATEDKLVADGIRYIRQNCHRPIQVVDVQKALGVSRRVLEHRFSHVIKRSPAAVIRRARLERAKRLLIETDLPIMTIAHQTGFNHPEVLIRTFRRELDVSPGEFRKRR